MRSTRTRVLQRAFILLLALALSSCGRRQFLAPQEVSLSSAELPPPLEILPVPQADPGSAVALPSPFVRLPFAHHGQICVYDRTIQDVMIYPGTGPNAQSVSELDEGQYYFDDTRHVMLFDSWREEQVKLVDGSEVGGFAFSPAFDDAHHLYFLGQKDRKLASQRVGLAYMVSEAPTELPLTSFASLPNPPDIGSSLGKPRFLSVLNAFALLHGQIRSLDVDGPGKTVVFSTGDGGIYLYSILERRLFPLFADEVVRGGFHAVAVAIDPVWGRYVVWQDARRKGLILYDRVQGELDTMPHANLASGKSEVSAPAFNGHDPHHVFFTAKQPGGQTKLQCYDILTEQVLNLTVLNAFKTQDRARVAL